MTRLTLKRALLGAAAALSLSLGPPAMAADHRDAPTIDDYSAIDINDVYMFRKPGDANTPGDPNTLVVALSTQAVADPLFGSSYHFQENALYRLNFTTRADAHPTASIDFVFGPFANGQQTFRAVFPNRVVVEGLATQGTSGANHNAPMIYSQSPGDIRVFAGPREDPFFFDLVGFNRAIANSDVGRFTKNFPGGPIDAFKGKNVNAIVVEFPVAMVFPNGKCTKTKVTPAGGAAAYYYTPCGVWGVTYLGDFRPDDPEHFEKHPEGLRQVDRMGNPAVNTALIRADLKDAFNFAEPKKDVKDFLKPIADQIALLDANFCAQLQNGCGPNPFVPFLASAAVPDVLRFFSDLPDGFPNPDLTVLAANGRRCSIVRPTC